MNDFFVNNRIDNQFAKPNLRNKESGKIECGKAHFEAIATGTNPAQFRKATKVDDLF